jgi:phosphatidylglycerophosphatase A
LGYLPAAPGTFGTLLGCALFYLLQNQSFSWLIKFTIVLCVFAMIVAHLAEKSYGKKDCQKIVIDEVVGVLIAYLFVSFSIYHLVLGFIFFRLFDIAKVWPAKLAQDKLAGGIGIVADDIVAGLQAGVLLYYFPVILLWVKRASVFVTQALHL